jgi:CBS domain-containing protein
MPTLNEWLRTQTAEHVMTRNVAVLRDSDSIGDAVRLFLREQITGAPVVNQSGECVGVLSGTDVLNFEQKRGASKSAVKTRRRSFDSWDWGEHWWREFGRIGEEMKPQMEEAVTKYMTRDVVSVAEDAPIAVVVRQMVDAHVHRVLVLDHERHPRGIITTMDVLSATLRAGRRERPVPVLNH